MAKQKIKKWLKRYLPVEIVGTVTAVSTASVAHFFSKNLILIAYTGSLGEALGFYSTIFIQDIRIANKKNRIENKTFSFSDILKITTNIILEFGPAGILDGLFLRPFFMYLFPIVLKNFTLGVFVGKIVGDFTFYILVVLSYEIGKQNKRAKSHSIK